MVRYIYMKLRHHVSRHVKSHAGMYKITGALAISSILLVGTFFATRGVAPAGELSFVEYSMLGKEAGSVMPASCESGDYHTDMTRYPWYKAPGVGIDSAPASANSPSPHYSYNGLWNCSLWILNTGARPSQNYAPGTDAQAWAQCKALYDSYAGQPRDMEYFGPVYDPDGLYQVSCYTPPPPPPPPVPVVNVNFQ